MSFNASKGHICKPSGTYIKGLYNARVVEAHLDPSET